MAAASDPHGGSLTTQLTQEEINALSDDPNELVQQLQDMAGGNAVIKIDSFVGGALPPKAFIKSIHIIRDTFPAENHSAENDEIDIITQAGVGGLRGGLTSRVRDGSAERTQSRSSTSRRRNGRRTSKATSAARSFRRSSPSRSRAAAAASSTRRSLPTRRALGKQSVLLGERPNNGWSMQGLVDYALTKDQALRLQYFHNDNARKNLGIGGFDLAERAYSNDSSADQFRVQEAGPIGRRFYLTTRLQFRHSDSAIALPARGADHSRPRWSHERRRPGLRRPAPERARHRLGPELRARHSTPCGPVSSSTPVTIAPTMRRTTWGRSSSPAATRWPAARRPATRAASATRSSPTRGSRAAGYVQDDIKIRRT